MTEIKHTYRFLWGNSWKMLHLGDQEGNESVTLRLVMRMGGG